MRSLSLVPCVVVRCWRRDYGNLRTLTNSYGLTVTLRAGGDRNAMVEYIRTAPNSYYFSWNLIESVLIFFSKLRAPRTTRTTATPSSI